MARTDGRNYNEFRKVIFHEPLQKQAVGSVIIAVGNTVVNCSVSFDRKVPPFLDAEESGWLTAEYSMLPASTGSRIPREASKGKQGGRTVEIQRLIGRSLRAVVDLKKIPGITLWVDCDVLQADGGTRTASISGACVALRKALNKMLADGDIEQDPLNEMVAAFSLGIVGGTEMVDLCYCEDSRADVDMNLVMTESGKFIELQGSSEGDVFSRAQLDRLLELGTDAVAEMVETQKKYLKSVEQL